MGPRIREDNGGEGQQDSSTPLRCARNDMWSGEEEGDGFAKLTNEVQQLVGMVPWESCIDKSPLKRGVRLPDYKPRGARPGRSLQIWIARHRQLLGS